jgi:hypothetical protein
MTLFRQRSSLLLLVLVLAAGCTDAAPNPTLPTDHVECPTEVDDVRDPAMAALVGNAYVAGVAVVHRFVASPEPQFRGYDISITSAFAGLSEADQVMFVVTEDRLPGIELGAEAIVFGRRGPRPAEIRSVADCPPLLRLAP